jgi:hypothetical protein
MTVADLSKVLEAVINSQKTMVKVLRELSRDMIVADNYDFENVYKKVLARQPVDPLEEFGITMAELDGLLDKYQNDAGLALTFFKVRNLFYQVSGH